ncbi:hypothetical protein Scep_017669 [Stephania cephalantha]|uniref:Uncharacterized protein n=1 Tax=Stephania cephalantha TaxID=152367 RepID=A0AAP0NX58_9MAGN
MASLFEDENIFSDRTLTSPSPQSPPTTAAAAASTPPPPPEIPSGSRQIWRRKKKGGGGFMEKIGRIRGAVSEVSKLRKEVARKRRKAAENVNLSAVKYRELEEELEEACEAEDFERVDRVSERLSEVEKERCNL